jgi:Flp pilus assembly protein TadD
VSADIEALREAVRLNPADPLPRADLGRALAAAGRHAEAAGEFRQAVRLDPAHPAYRADLGRALAAAGRHAEAEAEFREAVRLGPDDPGYRAEFGRALAAAGRHAEAEAEFREAVRLDPAGHAYQAGLGGALAALDRYAKAEPAFREAVRLEPGNPAYQAGLGRALTAMGRYAEAEPALREAVRLDPGNPAHHADLGRALADAGRHAEAKVELREAVALKPTNPGYRAGLADALAADGRPADAEREFREAVRLDPADHAYRAGLGCALAAQARFAEAETAFGQAVRLDPADPAHHADLGRALAAQARFAEAETAFEQAVRLDPADPAHHADLGRALLGQKRLTDAETELREAMRLDPGNPAYQADLGQVSIIRERHADAEKLFREAMQRDPGNPAYRAGLGRALSAQGHYAQAQRLFREAAHLDERAAEYRADLGRSLAASGRHAEAERLLREAIRLDPANPTYHADLGRSLSAGRRHAEAERLFREAIRLDPDNPANHADLGRALAAQGLPDDAEPALREAVALDPANPVYQADLGRTLAAQGRDADAGAAYREAVRLDPDNPAYHADLGRSLSAQGRDADAGAAYRQAAQLDPANPAYHADLGRSLSAQGRDADAEDTLREAVRLDPANPAYRADLGRSLARVGRHADAGKQFQEAVRLDPGHPAYHADLGRSLSAQGRDADAEDTLREAVRLDPAEPAFRAALGLVLLRRQQLSQAGIVLRQALELDPDAANAEVAALQEAVTTAYDAAITDYAYGLASRTFSKVELERRGVTEHQYTDQVTGITTRQLPDLRDAYRAWADAQPAEESGLQRSRSSNGSFRPKFMMGLCLLIAAASLAGIILSGDGTLTHSDEARLITEAAFLMTAVLGSCLAVFYSRRADRERPAASCVSMEEGRLITLIKTLVLEPAVTAALQVSWQDAETDRVSLRDGFDLGAKTDVANLIATEAKGQVAKALRVRHGAAVGVAGPRGSGKTELARMFTELGSLEPAGQTISLMLHAHSEYDARTFLLRLLKDLCGRIVEIGSGGREVSDPLTYLQGRRQLLTLYLIGGGLISCGMAGLLIILTGMKVSTFAPYAICCVLIFAGVVVLAGRVPPGRRRARNTPIRQQTIERAIKLRTRAQFTDSYIHSYTNSVGPGGSPSYGPTTSTTTEVRLESIPLTEMDVVRELDEIVKSVAEDHWQVIIAIDELDKMENADEAIKFLDRITALFDMHECSFIVSLPEDAWARFEKRGLPSGDALRSSFHKVVLVEILKPSESRDFLKRRNISITDAQALLCHCLSGGLPRDLIQAAQRLADAADQLQGNESKPPMLCRVVEKMLREDLAREMKASEMFSADGGQRSSISTNDDNATSWLNIWPDPKKTERRLADICKARGGYTTADPPSTPSDQTELEAHIAVLHTIRQAFSPGGPLTELMLKSPATDQLVDGFHNIAHAWQCLETDVADAWRFLHKARKTLKLASLQASAPKRAPSGRRKSGLQQSASGSGSVTAGDNVAGTSEAADAGPKDD